MRKWIGTVLLIVIAVALLSCARNQHLLSIQVIPSGPVTFEGVGGQIQFKAIGTYEHPPETKDVTSLATWSVDSQNLVSIDAPGLVTAQSICGSGNVMASINDPPRYVFATAFVTGAGIGTPACNSALLSVSISGTTGSGTITSNPSGINCPGVCTAVFPLNSAVQLTATPASGFNFGGWTNCTSGTSVCSVQMSGNESASATFN